MNKRNIQLNPRTMRGSVAVELALLLIPLIVLALGVAEFGRAMYQYNTVVKTVRDAARLLSQHSPSDTANYPETEARCLVVHGSADCSGSALLPGLTIGMVGIASSTTTTGAGASINLVTVTVTGYTFNFVFNPLVFFGSSMTTLPFDPIQTTMRQL
ncbi:TadE/TadG family type IV pilus assembly protein [Nitrosomonas ureae]|nr:TadE/TadG family type IV pilus assembly protein [Nitrosomonas ureae]